MTVRPFNQVWALLKAVTVNGQVIEPDEFGNYSAPGLSINNSAVGGQGATGSSQQDKMNQALTMLRQIQDNKLRRQQQMIDANLNPMTGQMQPQVPPMMNLPPVQQQTPVQQQPLMQDPSLQPINYNVYPPPPQM